MPRMMTLVATSAGQAMVWESSGPNLSISQSKVRVFPEPLHTYH